MAGDAHVFRFAQKPNDKKPAGWQRGWKVKDNQAVQELDEQLAADNNRLRQDGLSEERLTSIKAGIETLKEQRRDLVGSPAAATSAGARNWASGIQAGATITAGPWGPRSPMVVMCGRNSPPVPPLAGTCRAGNSGWSTRVFPVGSAISAHRSYWPDTSSSWALPAPKSKGPQAGGWPGYMQHRLIAYDAETGKEVWRCRPMSAAAMAEPPV